MGRGGDVMVGKGGDVMVSNCGMMDGGRGEGRGEDEVDIRDTIHEGCRV